MLHNSLRPKVKSDKHACLEQNLCVCWGGGQLGTLVKRKTYKEMNRRRYLPPQGQEEHITKSKAPISLFHLLQTLYRPNKLILHVASSKDYCVFPFLLGGSKVSKMHPLFPFHPYQHLWLQQSGIHHFEHTTIYDFQIQKNHSPHHLHLSSRTKNMRKQKPISEKG